MTWEDLRAAVTAAAREGAEGRDRAMALELHRLGRLVAALAEDLQHVERRQLEADDRRVGTVLLPLVLDLVGDASTTAPVLFALALEDRTPVGQALREVLADYGNPRQVGKLLARLDGAVLGGCRAVAMGERRDGRIWRIERVSED